MRRLSLFVGCFFCCFLSFFAQSDNADFVRTIKFVVADDANHNTAFPIDLVYTSDEEVAKKLQEMTARTFFQSKAQLLRDYPHKLMIVHWELVPGQEKDERVGENREATHSTFLFADYKTPGAHRMSLPPSPAMVIYLSKTDFEVAHVGASQVFWLFALTQNRDMIHIYTDGGCVGNPGPGAWAALLIYGEKRKEISGYEADTTNNRMELMAAVMALRSIKTKNLPLTIHTDSTYLKDGMTKWLQLWKQNGWKTAAKKPVKNQDLWEMLDDLAQGLALSWAWVKGHSGQPENEFVDSLVQKTIKLNKN